MRIIIKIIFMSIMLSSCAYTAESKNIDRAKSLIDQGVLALREGKLEKAEANFEVARDLAEIPAVYDGLGCVDIMRGRYQEAYDHLKYAQSLDPEYTQVYGNLALLFELNGQINSADTMYNYAIGRDPENFRVRNNYAAFKMRNGKADLKQIKIELRRAEALAPHPVITDNIERLR